MSEKLLLKEYTQLKLTPDVLKEYANDPKKPFTVVGIIQRADAKNQNGRIYPFEILKKEADRYMNEAVKTKTAFGELDHRDSPILELKNASHIIDDMWWGDDPEPSVNETIGSGKCLFGKIRLLDTPMGDIARKIVLAGSPLGISSRAVGSVSKNEAKGADMVGDDLQLVCWDLVGSPSTHGAFLKLHENFNVSKALPREVKIIQTLNELLKK